METIELNNRRQLKNAIKLLEQNIQKDGTYFCIKKNGLDEYIEANESGTLSFASGLISSVLNKQNNLSLLEYDLSKDNSDIWPTYIEFVKERKLTEPSFIRVSRKINGLETLLFGIGFTICIGLIIIGAFTVANYCLS